MAGWQDAPVVGDDAPAASAAQPAWMSAPEVGDVSGPVIRPDSTKVRAENVGRTFADAATLGLYGQFEAAMDAALGHGSQAPTFGQRFSENRANYEAEQNAMPLVVRAPTAIAGGVAGMMGPGGPVKLVAQGGKMLAEGVGAGLRAIPGVATVANALAPVATGAAEAGALGGTQGFIQGQGDIGDRLGAATTGAGEVGALGAAAPVVLGAVGGAGALVKGLGQAFTKSGQQSVARQVLEEAAGGPLPAAQPSALPSVALSTPQAMDSPALGGLQRTIVSDVPSPAGRNDLVVQGGVTPQQTAGLRTDMAAVSPIVAPQRALQGGVNDASARLVGGLQQGVADIKAQESALWNHPILAAVRLDGPQIATDLASDVGSMRPGFQRHLQDGTLGSLLGEIDDLGPNATLDQLNGIKSDIQSYARGLRTGGGNPTEAAAGEQLASRLTARIEAALPDDAMKAYQNARTFTAAKWRVLGQPAIQSTVKTNRWGNPGVNPEAAGGKFFDFARGTAQGPQQLDNVANFLDAIGSSAGNDLRGATRDYTAGRLMLDSGRANDATGEPGIGLDDLRDRIETALPWIRQNSAFAPDQVQRLEDVAASAKQLRQGAARTDSNSTTYEKLKQNDLLSAVIARSGLSAAGALGGAYEGYEHGPEGLPTSANVLGGALMGAGLASRFAPSAGNILAKVPVVNSLVQGPRNAILGIVDQALRDPQFAASLPPANTLATPPAPASSLVLTAPANALAGVMVPRR